MVFEQPDMTILSGHVEGKNIKELRSHIRVEIRSASDPSKVESVFPLPISNFFQVKDLPKGKHLLQLRSAIPSSTHKFESEVVEVDLESQPQIHVGPLSYRIEEDIHKQVISTCLPNCLKIVLHPGYWQITNLHLLNFYSPHMFAVADMIIFMCIFNCLY